MKTSDLTALDGTPSNSSRKPSGTSVVQSGRQSVGEHPSSLQEPSKGTRSEIRLPIPAGDDSDPSAERPS
jgi:hypothetical protein